MLVCGWLVAERKLTSSKECDLSLSLKGPGVLRQKYFSFARFKFIFHCSYRGGTENPDVCVRACLYVCVWNRDREREREREIERVNEWAETFFFLVCFWGVIFGFIKWLKNHLSRDWEAISCGLDACLVQRKRRTSHFKFVTEEILSCGSRTRGDWFSCSY